MLYLALSAFVGFMVVLLLTPAVMDFLWRSGIRGIDQQKSDRPQVPTSGGVAVLFGFLLSLTLFIGFETFLGTGLLANDLMLAALASVLTIALIGLIDDIHVRAEEEEVKQESQLSVGFSRWWIKPLLVVPAALPLMVVKAGHSLMVVPFIGPVEFGVVYPLVMVPIAVVAVSNATNMLAGQNGLETGMGTVALSSLGLFAYLNGSMEGAVVAFSMAGPLLGFFYYNKYPSDVLPGDSLTYGVGAAFIATTVIANIERFAIIVFLPWMVEAVLKLRSRFQASSLGKLREDGTLVPKHDAVYSLNHLLMRRRMTEKQIVYMLVLLETIICVIAFSMFL